MKSSLEADVNEFGVFSSSSLPCLACFVRDGVGSISGPLPSLDVFKAGHHKIQRGSQRVLLEGCEAGESDRGGSDYEVRKCA